MESAPPLVQRIAGLYAGQVQPMPGDGRPTAIFKQPVGAPVWLGVEGLEVDAQADRRVHGGPEKALHHYPARNYPRLAQRFPELAARFVPGSIGENLSTADWDEQDVCIGDVFALGGARIQLNQPRTPCWKIDARYGGEGITAFVAAQGISGWYYRVLQAGRVAPDDELRLIQRQPGTITLARFHALRQTLRPALDDLAALAAVPGLAPAWQDKLRERLRWLRENPGPPAA